MWGIQIHVARRTVTEKHGFGFGGNSNCTGIIDNCGRELALLVGGVSLGLERGGYFRTLLERTRHEYANSAGHPETYLLGHNRNFLGSVLLIL